MQAKFHNNYHDDNNTEEVEVGNPFELFIEILWNKIPDRVLK